MAVKRISTPAQRYAKAAYDLAAESSAVPSLNDDMQALQAMIVSSDDLSRLLRSPRVGAEAAGAALAAIAKKAKLSPVMANTVTVMALKGRKNLIPDFLQGLAMLFADQADQVNAQITSAHALTAKQADAIAQSLKAMAGKTVEIEQVVDEQILGGLVVKLGSTLIDDSVAGKLDRLKRKLVA